VLAIDHLDSHHFSKYLNMTKRVGEKHQHYSRPLQPDSMTSIGTIEVHHKFHQLHHKYPDNKNPSPSPLSITASTKLLTSDANGRPREPQDFLAHNSTS
jgi:hypothetical protein